MFYLFFDTVLVAAISRPGMNEVWLAGVSGAVLGQTIKSRNNY